MPDFSALQVVQSELVQKPRTITAAAEISPTTRFNIIEGTTPISIINPPFTGIYQELVFLFLSGHANGLVAGGNIQGGGGITVVTNRPISLYFNPIDSLWYVQTVA